MFETIIGYTSVTTQLSHAISTGTLPRAIVLEGVPYSGRGTMALEIARALMCEKKTVADCDCTSCLQHHYLNHPALMIFGPRNLLWDIMGAEKILETTGNVHVFRRSVRRIIRRFWLRSGSKKEECGIHLSAIEELLNGFSPSQAAQVLSHVKSLAQHEGNLGVDTIRAIIEQSNYTPNSRARVLILENFEKTNESSSNALLKLLEEPPPLLYIICTARSRHLLPPTIASRLYPYTLRPRNEKDRKEVARLVLQRTDIDIETFFHSVYLGQDTEELAKALLQDAGSTHFWKSYYELVATRDEKMVFFSLLDTCARIVSQRLVSAQAGDLLYLRSFWRKLTVIQHMVETRHVNPRSALEGMYFGK